MISKGIIMRSLFRFASSLILFLCCLTAHASSEVFYENASAAPVVDFIQSALVSIDIEIYEIQDTRVQAAVLKAMDRGVKVRIIQESESVGSNCPVFSVIYAGDTVNCKIQKQFILNVQSKGGTYIPYAYQQFCPAGKYRCYEHGKLIIVDRQKALVSTGNFNPTNLCDPTGVPEGGALSRCNRDYTVLTSDPQAVKTYLAVFESDLKSQPYDLGKILSDDSSKGVTVSPFSLSPLVQFIRTAKKTILIENQYLKNAELNAALIQAAKSGVKVYVVINSICTFSKPDPVKDQKNIELWKNTFKSFDAAGIFSRMFTKQVRIRGYAGYLHSKAIVVDGVKAWVGSVNGSDMALTRNREFGIFLNDEKEVIKLIQFITADFNDPFTESWQESLECKKD
jgi:phosphatidylserine/phosphatidylglycerophosphate/cardiolipin synthase-like enzyme